MRFLVDASLSPVVAQALTEGGHDALHVGDILPLDATDRTILTAAAGEQRVIVAADTDFGELLARHGLAAPSVVLFHRQTQRRPLEQAALLLSNLDAIEDDLQHGAIVVLEDRRLRVRRLPVTGNE